MCQYIPPNSSESYNFSSISYFTELSRETRPIKLIGNFIFLDIHQGSILQLGPLVFALCINDLPSVITHCHLDLYADDAELHAVIQICVLWRPVYSQT